MNSDSPADQSNVYADNLTATEVARLQRVPSGAAALAAAAVALLLLGWLFVYLFIYLPRGMVG